MEDKVLEEVGKNLIGDYGWLVVAGFAALLLKNTVGNMVAGAMFMFGNDFNVDDIVYIGGKTKSRITRISLQKTTFHIIDTDRKLIIPNTSLYGLKYSPPYNDFISFVLKSNIIKFRLSLSTIWKSSFKSFLIEF